MPSLRRDLRRSWRRPDQGVATHPARGSPDETVIVEYTGYGGGRGNPLDWLTWSSAGYPHMMDTRGQGGAWRSAETSDLGDGGQPSSPGFLTRGISDPPRLLLTQDFRRCRPGPSTRPGVTPTLPAWRIVTDRLQPRGRSCARCCTPGRRRVCDVARRPIPRASASSRRDHREHALCRTCAVLPSPPRRDRTGIPHGLVHRTSLNHAKRCAVPALFLCRPARRGHARINRLRCLQPLCRSEGNRRVQLQWPRGRRHNASAETA